MLVGLCLDRSIELIVALLGILKAGAAFLPLDPTYPFERRTFMLEDSQAQVLITTNDQRATTNEDRGLKIEDSGAEAPEMLSSILCPRSSSRAVVDLSADWPAIEREPVDNLGLPISLAHPAYVVYTSGSTGDPKGVVVSRRSLANLCRWYRDHCPVTKRSRVLLALSFSFDASLKNILTPLLVGDLAVAYCVNFSGTLKPYPRNVKIRTGITC